MEQLLIFVSEKKEKAKFVLWMATLKKKENILFSEGKVRKPKSAISLV